MTLDARSVGVIVIIFLALVYLTLIVVGDRCVKRYIRKLEMEFDIHDSNVDDMHDSRDIRR